MLSSHLRPVSFFGDLWFLLALAALICGSTNSVIYWISIRKIRLDLAVHIFVWIGQPAGDANLPHERVRSVLLELVKAGLRICSGGELA